MINKLTVSVSVILILVMAFFVYKKYFIVTEVHYHAGFRVFNDGALQDFSGPEYMSLKPCSIKDDSHNEQDEKGHLHDRIGYVVHVHQANSKWSDLFKNIHYPLDTGKPFTAYINGKMAAGFPDVPIQPYDSLVLLIGRHKDSSQYLKQAVTKQMIRDVEKRSELCGSGS